MNNTSELNDNTWVYTALNVTSGILFTIGFPSNLIIIYLVFKHQHLRNATNYFVSSLAIADLSVLVSMLFWIIGIKVITPMTTEMKYVFSSLDLTTGILCMLNVFCVSADRAIAVTYPLRYERIVTKRRSLIITVTVMGYSLCLLVVGIARCHNPSVPEPDSTIPVINTYHRVVDYIAYGNFFVAILGTIICYTLIFLIVFHKLKGTRKLERLMLSTRHAFDDESNEQREISQERKMSRSILFREVKVTGNIMVIVFPFTAGWTFFVGTNVYEDTFGYVKSIAYNLFMIIVPWLLSVLNPIIYLMVNRQLRQTFFKTLQKLRQKREYPFMDESRLSMLALSRRASSTRTSSTVDGGELVNIPRNIRKSLMTATNSARSSASMDKSAFEAVPVAS